MIKAVLFDMDGVLVDSEEFICQAAIKMFKEKNIQVNPEDFIPFVGAGEDRYIGGVAEKYAVKLNLDKDKARTYEIYGELVKDKLQPLEGVMDFIKECKKRNLKMAVATSADKPKMLINLKESNINANNFDVLINGLDIKNKKPDPEIYLLAAQKLNVDPTLCLVVEDAVNGVEAAKRAGCKCLAVTTSFSAKELKHADWVTNSLKNIPNNLFYS